MVWELHVFCAGYGDKTDFEVLLGKLLHFACLGDLLVNIERGGAGDDENNEEGDEERDECEEKSFVDWAYLVGSVHSVHFVILLLFL